MKYRLLLLTLFLGAAIPSVDAGLIRTFGVSTSYALAFDPVSGNLFNMSGTGLIEEWTTTGAFVGSYTDHAGITRGLHFASADLNVGGTSVPANSLLGFSKYPLYALDRSDMTVLATQVLYLLGDSCVAYHPYRGTVFTGGNTKIFEVDPSNGTLLNSFVLHGSAFSGDYGGMTVGPTGNLHISALGAGNTEYTPDGVWVADYVRDGIAGGLAYNWLKGEMYHLRSNTVYVYDGYEVIPEPSSLVVLGLGLVGLAARRRRKQMSKRDRKDRTIC